jgi:hypothetical protein
MRLDFGLAGMNGLAWAWVWMDTHLQLGPDQARPGQAWQGYVMLKLYIPPSYLPTSLSYFVMLMRVILCIGPVSFLIVYVSS